MIYLYMNLPFYPILPREINPLKPFMSYSDIFCCLRTGENKKNQLREHTIQDLVSSYAEQYSQVKNSTLAYCGDGMFLKIDVIICVADFFNAMIFSETPNVTT